MESDDKKLYTPKYVQIEDHIISEIRNGRLKTGDRIPSEAELVRMFGVSRITVRRAIDELVEEGYLEKKQGKGTFVTQKRAAVPVMSISENATVGFSGRYGQDSGRLHSIVISKKEYKANRHEQKMLNLEEGDEVLVLTRLMILDDKPWMIDRATYSAKRYPGFLEQIEDGVSTYNIMCEQYGVRMRRAYREITLAYATNEQAKMLGCAPSAPLFKTFKVVYDEQGLPVHMSSTYTQADNVVLTVENGNYRKELIEK